MLTSSLGNYPIPPFLGRRLGRLAPGRFAYDGFCRLHPWQPRFLLTHPDDIRYVLVTGSEHYQKDARIRDSVGDGVLTSQGRRHKELRKIFLPALSGDTPALVESATRLEMRAMLAQWRDGQILDLAQEMPILALRILLRYLLGPEHRHRDALSRAIALRQQNTEALFYGHLPLRWFLSRWGRRAQATLSDFIHARLACRRRTPEEDVLSALARVCEDDKAVHDEALTLTSTGHETLAQALTWTLALLAKNRESAERVAEEARVGQPAVFTEGVFFESLRLYPPTWIYSRTAIRDDVLPSSHSLKAGANLMLCQYLMHRHPGYFSDPERFDPARFLDPNWRARLRSVYFPFGMGGHICLGEKLARLQAITVLGEIFKSFRLQPVTVDLEPVAGLVLRPGGSILVRIEARA